MSQTVSFFPAGFHQLVFDSCHPRAPRCSPCHIFPSVHCFRSSGRYIITKRPPLMIICQQEGGGGAKLAITTETETEMRRCLPKHRFFSCYDFCGGSRSRRRTPHYLGERGTQTFSFLISKVQTRRRHPSSSPMTDCCNYSGILSDGGGGAAE